MQDATNKLQRKSQDLLIIHQEQGTRKHMWRIRYRTKILNHGGESLDFRTTIKVDTDETTVDSGRTFFDI